VLLLPADDPVDVEPVHVADATRRVGHRDDRRALLGHELGGDRPGIAEPLDRDARGAEVHAQVLGSLDHRVDAATRRRLVAPLRPAQRDRLAGDDARDGVPDMHRVRVHHPGHHLGVGVHVGGGDVALRADEDLDLGREPAGQRLELLHRELLGVDDHAALATAVRDAHDGALPGHPHREGLDLVEGHVLVVADAALGRAAAQVVLDAIAGEDGDGPVVHLHGEVHGQLAAGLAENPAQARVEREPIGGQIELPLGDVPGVDRRRGVLGRHERKTSGRRPMRSLVAVRAIAWTAHEARRRPHDRRAQQAVRLGFVPRSIATEGFRPWAVRHLVATLTLPNRYP
jgi:hypothetical protein